MLRIHIQCKQKGDYAQEPVHTCNLHEPIGAEMVKTSSTYKKKFGGIIFSGYFWPLMTMTGKHTKRTKKHSTVQGG